VCIYSIKDSIKTELISGSESLEFMALYHRNGGSQSLDRRLKEHRNNQPEEFSTIIIDETHRIGSESYQRILEYFQPNLWLGMTASPERTDGFDVYEAYNHNIVYEIRLQQALEENLLCPFHYFGITDLQIDGETVDEETGLKDFNRLTSDDRVNYVIEQVRLYFYS
jgi:superfamily II DNA or RNA helicase